MTLSQFRNARLTAAAYDKNADLLIASLPQNILYMTGYKSIAQHVLHRSPALATYEPATGRTVFVMSIAELPSIVETVGPDAEIYAFGGFRFAGVDGDALAARVVLQQTKLYATAEAALAAAINSTKAKCVALDESRVSVTSWNQVAEACPNVCIVPGSDVFMNARTPKHPEEIAGLEMSVEIAEQAFLTSLSMFHAGMTELELEQLYRTEISRRGGENFFFVATGAKRAAYSDTKNTSLRIHRGDMIRFDFGCIYNGYTSDIARTAIVGEDKKVSTYYEAVRCGTRDAIAAIKPGILAEDVFKIAVESTRKNGIPHYDRHHCGHGIGLEVYDLPSIAAGCQTPLAENMTLCIETPYYELGWGGVQIENTIAVTADGSRYLDKSGDSLIILNS